MKEPKSDEKKNHFVLAYKTDHKAEPKIYSFGSSDACRSEMISTFKDFLSKHLDIESVIKNVIFSASNTDTIESVEQIVIQYKGDDSKHVAYQSLNTLSMYDFEKIKLLETTFNEDITDFDDICKTINGLIIKNILPFDNENNGLIVFAGALDKDPGFKNEDINLAEISDEAKEPKRYLNRFATNDSLIVGLSSSTSDQDTYVIYSNTSWSVANELLQNNSWVDSVSQNLSTLINEIDTNNPVGLYRKNLGFIAHQDPLHSSFSNSLVLHPKFISHFAQSSGRTFNFKLYPVLSNKSLFSLCSYGWIRSYIPEPNEVLSEPVISISNDNDDLNIIDVVNKNEKALNEYTKANFLLLSALLSYLFENNAARGFIFVSNEDESVISSLGEPCLVASQMHDIKPKTIFRAIDLGQPIASFSVPTYSDGTKVALRSVEGQDLYLSEVLLTTIKSERGRSLGDDTYAVVFVKHSAESSVGYKAKQAVLFKDKSEAVDMFVGSLEGVLSYKNKNLNMFSSNDKAQDVRKTAKKVVSLFELEDKATLNYENMQKLFLPQNIEFHQQTNI